ncbi:hypothetical protein [Paenibacillus sp. TSA_86.1]|uniref:hypothetical protein n=1 Tax=Paenibacillus sp. TSA_86.1 TaxID=3415649 RepID=UPI004045A129
MTKNMIKRMVDIAAIIAVGIVVYVGYFVFFDKPDNQVEITSLYVKMGYAFLALFIILLLRMFVNRNKSKP